MGQKEVFYEPEKLVLEELFEMATDEYVVESCEVRIEMFKTWKILMRAKRQSEETPGIKLQLVEERGTVEASHGKLRVRVLIYGEKSERQKAKQVLTAMVNALAWLSGADEVLDESVSELTYDLSQDDSVREAYDFTEAYFDDGNQTETVDAWREWLKKEYSMKRPRVFFAE